MAHKHMIAREHTPGAIIVVERLTGIEPAYQAWEACALPLSYSRTTGTQQKRSVHVYRL